MAALRFGTLTWKCRGLPFERAVNTTSEALCRLSVVMDKLGDRFAFRPLPLGRERQAWSVG